MAKLGKHKTVESGHSDLHHKFSKGGALKKSGHHGIIGEKNGKGKGNFIVSPSNVGKLGHK